MMAWGEIGIKDADDVLQCMRNGASARALYDLYGARIGPLISAALDRMWSNQDTVAMHAIACEVRRVDE